MIIHGGYWKQCYNLDNSLIGSLVPFFVERGFAVVHIEYRRVQTERHQNDHGGWPLTNLDVLESLNKLFEISTTDQFKVSFKKNCIQYF